MNADLALAEPVADLRPVSGPQVWYGPDVAGLADWRHELTDAERDELEAAVAAIERRGLEILGIGAGDFPLPRLAARLAAIRREVLHGRGFFLLRGLPVERWTTRQSAIAFWGLGTHLGEAVSQNGKGHVLGHVKDLGLDYSAPTARGYQTSARLPYHTDSSDVVGLLCLKTSRTGGASSIVSSTTLYNEMLRRRPDLARVLTRPVCKTRWGEIPEGRKPWAEVPVFMPHGGRVIVSYVRSAVRKAQQLEGIPPLTPEQIEAMDMLDALAEDPTIHLDMAFRPGDVQLVCNHSIMHSRTAYEDWPEPEQKRHLLRLWLACDDGPPLPALMIESYQGKTKGGRPNGIAVPGVPFKAPLEAE